jgi:hypothetical protein
MKYDENPFSESRVVQCGQTEGQKDMTKLIVTFGYFTNVPENKRFRKKLPGFVYH